MREVSRAGKGEEEGKEIGRKKTRGKRRERRGEKYISFPSVEYPKIQLLTVINIGL